MYSFVTSVSQLVSSARSKRQKMKLLLTLTHYKEVWVFAEQRHGKLMNVALELIGEGYRLAKEISEDTKVCAVLVGDKAYRTIWQQECFRIRRGKSLSCIQDPLLKNYTTDGYTKVI